MRSSAASDVYKRQIQEKKVMSPEAEAILKDAITEVVSTMVASAA
jgi:F-type H+-transporting ATPase subunit alpha